MVLFGNTTTSAINCSAAALPYPSIFGATVLALSASLVTNFSTIARGEYNPNHDTIHASNLSFCNITVEYTHPGQNDRIATQVWLPISTWNGRMQAVGGGGWQAGLMPYSYIAMAGAAAEGYAAVTTDGGHHSSAEPTDWALLGPGNVDLYTLQNFGSRSLNDSATIGKSLIQDFYGEPPKFSYWSGCSQGGRQGLMLAQRYPTAFDGIAASAPATNWAEFIVGGFWPQLVMNEMQEYPYPCELDALTLAAIDACDADDGVRDGIIAEPDSCQFDAYTAIGTSIHCRDTGSEIKISKAAAAVAEAAWTGAQTSDGRFLWYGVGHSANLTSLNSLASTQCFPNGKCIGKPVSLITDFIRLFVKKDPSYDISNITRHEYESLFRAAVQEYTSIIGTNYPDLSEFRNSGGKMVAYHGQADEIIPFRNTRHYYHAVAKRDFSVRDYYRVFESPGLAHCVNGRGAYPAETFHALVEWVENGKVPDVLHGMSLPDENGAVRKRILCPYPEKARYKGSGDPNIFSNWYCEKSALFSESGSLDRTHVQKLWETSGY